MDGGMIVSRWRDMDRHMAWVDVGETCARGQLAQTQHLALSAERAQRRHQKLQARVEPHFRLQRKLVASCGNRKHEHVN